MTTTVAGRLFRPGPSTGAPHATHSGATAQARIGEHVGQRNLAVTANIYTHVLSDELELDYEGMLR